ncbi:hypothetical protein SHAb15599_00012 [Acinetobacter phage SH-Ab 15599]|nr:hypothetical protein SHAb15599_00012 [Acinetobacter phage SH-Ab 15599]
MTIHAFINSALYRNSEISGQYVVFGKEPKDKECKRDFYLKLRHPDTGKEFGVHIYAKDVIFKDENANIVHLANGRVKSSSASDSQPSTVVTQEPELTDEELDRIIYKRFQIMSQLSDSLILGHTKALIISGAPGISKTFTLEQKLDDALESGVIESFEHLKGRVTPLQLFVKLYENKDPGHILLIDDVNLWGEENSIELLKAALDTGSKRSVTWASTASWLKEQKIPESFEYEGSVCFITNVDFDRAIARNTSASVHLKALISRANYLDLKVHSNKEILIRVKQIVRDSSILQSNGLSEADGKEMLQWMEDNIEKLRELSLRTVLKIASYMNTNRTDWTEIAEVMLLKK